MAPSVESNGLNCQYQLLCPNRQISGQILHSTQVCEVVVLVAHYILGILASIFIYLGLGDTEQFTYYVSHVYYQRLKFEI